MNRQRVVSLGDDARERDYTTKRELYARAGIAEYWIVDPLTETVSLFVLEHGSYRTVGEFPRGSTVASLLLPGFLVAVDEILAAGEPDDQAIPPN